MVSQVILPLEFFSTNITVEGALICMSPFVDQKVIGLGELTLAVLAVEGALICIVILQWLDNMRDEKTYRYRYRYLEKIHE